MGCLIHHPQPVGHVHRDTDSAALVCNRARDRLPDPPGGISGEAEAALVLELRNCFHQAQVTLLDQVKEGHPAPDVFFGYTHYQASIRFDQVLAR
jgi:hypothetical protein